MAVTLSTTHTSTIVHSGASAPTPVGYCHDLILKVFRDGTVNTLLPDGSTSTGPIIFGNKGDLNITRISFNIEDLQYAENARILTDYTARIVIQDTTTSLEDTRPMPFIVSKRTYGGKQTGYWIVPESLLAKATTYRCIFTLTEYTASKHTISETEQWVSQEFTAIVNNTLWDSKIATTITNNLIHYEDEQYGFLTKIPILLSPDADHYKINVDNSNLGMKHDMYVKRLEFREDGLDEGFVYKYGIFCTLDERVYAVRFNAFKIDNQDRYVCLIPKEVTENAGIVRFCIVATTEDVEDNPQVAHDGFKRWVGNTLEFTVTDNFLSIFEDEPPLMEIDSSFLTADGLTIITADDLIFDVQEE